MPEVVVKYSGKRGALVVDGLEVAGEIVRANVTVAAGHARLTIDIRGSGVDNIAVDLDLLDIVASGQVSSATARVLQALVPPVAAEHLGVEKSGTEKEERP